MLEDFQYALKGFKHNKIRTFLSLLGVIIGVMSVIIITTIGESATANIKNSFGSLGLDLIQVSASYRNRRAGANSITINDDFREKVYNNVENIKDIYFVYNVSGKLRYGENETTCSISAVENGYVEDNSLQIDKGETITITDAEEGLQKILIGSEVASILFNEDDPVGKLVTLDMNGILFGFRVKGVLADKQSMFGSSKNAAYVPKGFYQKKINPKAAASQMVIKATSEDYASKIASDVEAYADSLTGTDHSVSVMSMSTMIENSEETLGTVSMLLSAIAAISLLVGGIGIMNIMIVTVTERKKEIGIRKALGASPKDIRIQFLVESATISLTGGLLGILFGIIVSAIIVYFLKWKFALSLTICIGAFLFSAVVGIFFGLNPASRAAKLDPVEALSAE
ncbi:MAG: ABC transporter permease [Treponema sp.]|nr:ABC transporter permease [Treponema sp.]